MISLPPGCSINHEIRFTVGELTDEMGDWFVGIGGLAWQESQIDWRGREYFIKHVRYGSAKPSHRHAGGNNSYPNNIIRFNGTDAAVALLFLIKFMDEIVEHNMEKYLHD